MYVAPSPGKEDTRMDRLQHRGVVRVATPKFAEAARS